MNFIGKTAVITGAGRGLGYVYARELARLGANVVISDIGADKVGDGADAAIALDAAHALQAEGFKVIGHSADLASEQGCRQLIETAVEAFGQLDILIHNAGWVGYQSIEDADAAFIERALGISVYTPIWLCKSAWQHLRQSAAARVVLTTSDRAMYQPYAQPGPGGVRRRQDGATGHHERPEHGGRGRGHPGQRSVAGRQNPNVGRERSAA